MCPTNVSLEATLPAALCYTLARPRRLRREAGPPVPGCSGRPWRPRALGGPRLGLPPVVLGWAAWEVTPAGRQQLLLI